MKRRFFVVILVITAMYVGIVVRLPLLCQTLATLILAGLLPGLLFVRAWIDQGKDDVPWWEGLLYAIGMGYAIIIVVMLGLSYLPGGLSTWQIYLAFGILLALLLWWIALIARPSIEFRPKPANPAFHWSATPFLLLLIIASFFRFTNLGYAEFQGDEARAALRAAAVIQGFEETLLIHKKGPSEVLLPTLLYVVTGQLTETTARLPFAIANLTALFAIFLLGTRLFNPLAGFVAALLLAVDGYYIGFSRIVQYQSIVILCSALSVLVLYRLVQIPNPQSPWEMTRYLTLAALFLATGMLSHYEAGLALIPVGYLLCVLIWRERQTLGPILRGVGIAVITGAILLGIFYIPFVLHPHFSATFRYLSERRIGSDSFPYNNVADFFLRTTIYNTTYDFVLKVALLFMAFVLACRQSLGRRWALLSGGLLITLLALTTWHAKWLRIGETDYLFVLFLLGLLLVWLLPKLSVEERTVWLWFGLSVLLAFFFTAKPRTHVYVFFTPWALLIGMAASSLWQMLRRRIGQSMAITVGMATGILLLAAQSTYAYWYFVHNQVEVLHTWETNRPAGYWVAYEQPDNRGIFGFPLANGWKVVGMLYEQGVITGDFETNEHEAWLPIWYTRGQRRCGYTADWYFEIETLEPFDDAHRQNMQDFLTKGGFNLWGMVEINDAPRMRIHSRTEQVAEPHRFVLTDYADDFDAITRPDLPLSYPVVNPSIGNPLHINLNNQIWLEGYDLEYNKPLQAGDTMWLTLYWRAQQPVTESYKVFNQSYYGNGTMVAQWDAYPVCGRRGTWLWDPGELITDVHQIPIKPNAPDGLYPLITGLYLEEEGRRVDVLDDDGIPVANQIHLTDIRIGE